MRALTRSAAASLLALAAPVLAQTYEPALIPSQINGAPDTMTPLQLGDDSTANVDLGFEFTYWDQVFTSAWVSSNGFVSFQSPANLCCNGQQLEQAQRNTIYGLWTDLVSYSGNPYYRRGQGSILFGWYGTNEYGTQNQYTFEVGLFDDNKIQFNYGALPSLRYHWATAGITGPNAGDNILLFYGNDPNLIQNQSNILVLTKAAVAVDCNVTPMDPSCPPEVVPAVQVITTEPVSTIQMAYAADVQSDQADIAAATISEPEQEIDIALPEEEPAASVTERVAELVAAERLSPDQVAALAASPPPAVVFGVGEVTGAPTPTGALSGSTFGAATNLSQSASPTSTTIAALEVTPSQSSPSSIANTLEVLNTLSAPAPQAAVEQQPTDGVMAEGQGEVMTTMAAVPGFSAYTQVALQDRPDFYAVRDIYRNRRLRDANFEMYRLTRTSSDKLQEMIDAQYRR